METIKLANVKLEAFLKENNSFEKFIERATKHIGVEAKKELETDNTYDIGNTFFWKNDEIDYWHELHRNYLLYITK